MLDDLSYKKATAVYFAILGPEFFRYTLGHLKPVHLVYNIPLIQKMRNFVGAWRYTFAVTSQDDYDHYYQLQKLAVPFTGICDAHILGIVETTKLLQSVQLVYAPSFCSVYAVRPALRPPASPKIALDMIEHFATVMDAFTLENYRLALTRYDSSVHRGSFES